jgi:hypothetical protein
LRFEVWSVGEVAVGVVDRREGAGESGAVEAMVARVRGVTRTGGAGLGCVALDVEIDSRSSFTSSLLVEC